MMGETAVRCDNLAKGKRLRDITMEWWEEDWNSNDRVMIDKSDSNQNNSRRAER
jgi:hypothetical protein